MTVAEFAQRNRISTGHYFVMRRRGDGPKETRIGRKVLISPEAEADWRRKHESD